MLADPMLIMSPADFVLLSGGSLPGGVSYTLRLQDLSPGRTVRIGAIDLPDAGVNLRSSVTISHSLSKENKGTDTDRAAIRLDVRKNVEGVGDVVAQATLTVSSPRAGYTQSDIKQLVLLLLNTIVVGDDGLVTGERLERVLAGEP